MNFSPAPENTLMPLSSNGLCDAEITTPAVYPMRGVKYAMAGVGMMPAPVSDPSWLLMPKASSRSIHAPDSRVSRPDKKPRSTLPSSGRAPACAAPRQDATNRWRIEWIRAGLAAHAVSAERRPDASGHRK